MTELEDINYKDDAVIGYGLTLTAVTDSTGVSHYEYEKTAGSGSSGTS